MIHIILAIAIVAFIVGSDIVLAVDGIEGNTYSELLRTLSYRWPVIPAAGGAILGHWFLNMSTPRPPGGLVMLLGFGLVITLADVFSSHAVSSHTHPAQWMLFGLAVGSYFWSLPPA